MDHPPSRLSTVHELLGFFWAQREWWLIPTAFALVALGLLCTVAQSSAIAPLMYSIF